VKEGRGRRRGAREGACTGAATMPQPSTLRLILNAAGALGPSIVSLNTNKSSSSSSAAAAALAAARAPGTWTCSSSETIINYFF
jgi:hypothetical protein